MINQIAGVVGSIYYVSEADKAKKDTQIHKFLRKEEVARITKIQRVNRISAISEHDKKVLPQNLFRTALLKDEQNRYVAVMTTSRKVYREINLQGRDNTPDYTLINPMKVKKAYFGDEV